MTATASCADSHAEPPPYRGSPGDGPDRQMDAAVQYISQGRLVQPQVAIVLGSGLGGLAEDVEHATRLPYIDIPNFQATHAIGHCGQLVMGYLAGMQVVVMQGRYHRYEGHSTQSICFPIRVMAALGAKTLLVTNAAGGLNPRYVPGDLMLVDQHIDCLWPRGQSLGLQASAPSGPEAPGCMRRPREVYDEVLLRQAGRIAQRHGVNVQRGTYVATLGPTYETRAEYRMFRWMGGDAVGMSTVPEVMTARQCGLRVLAMSVITNVACTDQLHGTTHDEVVERGKQIEPKLRRIVAQLLEEMAGPAD
jgi:purine-nucleoside phosphorylase